MTICDLHDDIDNTARAIVRLVRSVDLDYDSEKDTANALGDVEDLANTIMQLAMEAKERGQAMENRLYEYYSAITSIGFVRMGR